MRMSAKDLISEARQQVAAVSPGATAANTDAFVLDVRETAELSQSGYVEGSLHIPRGILESRADPSSPIAHPDLIAHLGEGEINVLCASGARAALAAYTLKRMGYTAKVIEGGITAWAQQGHPVIAAKPQS